MHVDSSRGSASENPLAGETAADRAVAAASAEERRQKIAAAAYRRYEQRAGAPGDPLNDWLEAEREVDRAQSAESWLAENAAAAKSAFLRGLAAALIEAQVQLEAVSVKAKAASVAVRRKYEEQLRIAMSKCEVTRGKLAEIREHTDGAWGHLKEGAEKAAQEMSVAVSQLASLFR